MKYRSLRRGFHLEPTREHVSFSAHTDLPLQTLKVADLCCGIGAVTEASLLHEAEVVAAADIDPLALLQYEHRHGEHDIQ